MIEKTGIGNQRCSSSNIAKRKASDSILRCYQTSFICLPMCAQAETKWNFKFAIASSEFLDFLIYPCKPRPKEVTYVLGRWYQAKLVDSSLTWETGWSNWSIWTIFMTISPLLALYGNTVVGANSPRHSHSDAESTRVGPELWSLELPQGSSMWAITKRPVTWDPKLPVRSGCKPRVLIVIFRLCESEPLQQ